MGTQEPSQTPALQASTQSPSETVRKTHSASLAGLFLMALKQPKCHLAWGVQEPGRAQRGWRGCVLLRLDTPCPSWSPFLQFVPYPSDTCTPRAACKPWGKAVAQITMSVFRLFAIPFSQDSSMGSPPCKLLPGKEFPLELGEEHMPVPGSLVPCPQK